MNNLLTTKPKDLLDKFLDHYDEIHKIDKQKAKKLIKENTSFYNKKIEKPPYIIELEKKWYDSLNLNKIDYSIYDDEYYFTDIWSCWCLFSRPYILSIIKDNSLDVGKSIFSKLKNIKSIVDLGCGIGYSTTLLKEIFINCDVYGTNLEQTKQYPFVKKISFQKNFNLVPNINEINKQIDLVFASEYFEHIERPIEHLEETINKLNPKFLFLANSFNTISVGHFEKYIHDHEIIDQKLISRKFNKYLTDNGYVKVKTKLWNNKPALWERNES